MKQIHSGMDEQIYQIVIHILVVIIVVLSIFPLVYVISMSLTTLSEAMRNNYFVLIPSEPTLEAYKRILQADFIRKSFVVSVFRTVIGTFIMLVLTTLGAYVLSWKSLPGRKLFLLMILGTILFKPGMIPNYLMVKNLKLLNTFWSLIVPLAIDSFGLLVIKVFIENLSDELTEAAIIDGAGKVKLLIHVIVPLVKPALVAIGLFNIVLHWNNWFDALLYIHDKSLYPYQLVLMNMFKTGGQTGLDMSSLVLGEAQRVSTKTMRMAVVVTGIIPIMCVYPFLQKHFAKGILLGSVKG